MKKFIAIGVFAVMSAGIMFVWQNTDRTSPAFSIGAANAQEQSTDADTSGITEMAQGPEDAKVTVLEYASFTCPHCADFHADIYPHLKRDYIDTGKIRFVYRDVYFDKLGLWASMLARCDASRFFGISGVLYDKQSKWLDGKSEADIANNLRTIGKTSGLSEEQVNACLEDNDKAKALVAWYQENAKADDITGTPSLVINGTKYSNMPYDELKEILDAKLAE